MRLEVTLPTHPDSVAAARRALDPLRERMEDLAFRDARLLVSELVTNAVRHVPEEVAGEIALTIEHGGGRIRVEVRDGGRGFEPQPRAAPGDLAGGWGLEILRRVAARWGIEREPSTCVWFELEDASRRNGAAP